jgi:hypothetical protein
MRTTSKGLAPNVDERRASLTLSHGLSSACAPARRSHTTGCGRPNPGACWDSGGGTCEGTGPGWVWRGAVAWHLSGFAASGVGFGVGYFERRAWGEKGVRGEARVLQGNGAALRIPARRSKITRRWGAPRSRRSTSQTRAACPQQRAAPRVRSGARHAPRRACVISVAALGIVTTTPSTSDSDADMRSCARTCARERAGARA